MANNKNNKSTILVWIKENTNVLILAGAFLLIVILFVINNSGTMLTKNEVIVLRTSIKGEATDNPQDLRVLDFRLELNGTATYKKKEAGFISKDFDLYTAKISSKQKSDLLDFIDKKGFFGLPEVVGKSEGASRSVSYLSVKKGSELKTITIENPKDEKDLLEILTKLDNFSAEDEVRYEPPKVTLLAIPLSGLNAENAKKYMKPKNWDSNVKLVDLHGSAKEYSGAEAKQIVEKSGREFQVYLIEKDIVYQAFIKWEV